MVGIIKSEFSKQIISGIIDKNILNVINEIKNIPRMIDIKYFTDDYQNLIKSIEELEELHCLEIYFGIDERTMPCGSFGA